MTISLSLMNPSNLPQVSSITDAVTKANYEPPGAQDSTLFGHHHPIPPNKAVDYVHNPTDGSVLLDHKGRPVTVDKLLATKPLRNELSTRPGPGNKKLTYISGEGVSRTLNDIFGFDGWNLDIQDTQQVEMKQLHGKYHVVYTAQVRLTHKNSGAYKEDCGAGDSADKSLAIAVAHALKASITDAMKRAARHFGDKLGNSLYSGGFHINKAPTTLKDALDKCDIERAKSKFGFLKDQIYNQTRDHQKENISPPTATSTTRKPTNLAHPSSSGTTTRRPLVQTLSSSSTNNPSALNTIIMPTKHINTRQHSAFNPAAPAQAKQQSQQQEQQRSSIILTQQPKNAPPSRQPVAAPLAIPPNLTSSTNCGFQQMIVSTSNIIPNQQQRPTTNPSIHCQQQSFGVLPVVNSVINHHKQHVGPPPTPTDGLRNSILYSSEQPKPSMASNSSAYNLLPPTATDAINNSVFFDSSSSLSLEQNNKQRPNTSRLSIDQTQIANHPLITPVTHNSGATNTNINPKRPPNEQYQPYNNKKQRHQVNPYNNKLNNSF